MLHLQCGRRLALSTRILVVGNDLPSWESINRRLHQRPARHRILKNTSLFLTMDLQFNDETKVCRVLKSTRLSLTLFQKELATFIEREQAQVLAFAVSCF